MTALVTGASGHLGNNVVRALLASGRKVRALVHRESASLAGLDVDRHRGDILDRSSLAVAMKDVTTVFHFAGVVSLDPKDGPRVMEANVVGTRNVVEACLASGVSRLIHASSIHALAAGGLDDVTNERRPQNSGRNAAAYDRSKVEGEAGVRAGIERGLHAVVLNPTAVIGPFDFLPRLAGRALIDLYRGKLRIGVAGGFNWVDARDVAAGALAAESDGRPGERYLLSGEWASFQHIATLMREATGRKGPAVIAPLWLARLGVPFIGAYAALSGSRPIYTASELRVLTEHRHCDNAKAKAQLRFSPRPLRDTIADTFAFYRQAGLLETTC